MADLIFLGNRGSGKTTELIKKSAETGIYILVLNEKRRREVFEQAKKLGYYIPNPVTIDDYFRCKFQGSCIQRDGLYIDEVEDILRYVFKGIPIKGMTLTTRNNLYELEELD